MEANDFITKLKADGSENDLHDLNKVYSDYKGITAKLSSKDQGSFSLNVLCVLCRNLDKVPSWRDKIECKDLLPLSIDCVRETRALDRSERVKTLACIYHIHKYVVRQPSQLPPELVLKLAYMPFEYELESLLHEYCKTYWNLLADRLMYMDKLKSGRRAIIKLLPKLTEDTQKVIHMYDSVQFCSTILVFLLKKLHFLYNNEHAKDLNVVFGKIFESLSLKKDVKAFKNLTEKDVLDLYVKFSDSFYIITENGTKLHFKDSCLNLAIRTCISFIGHAPDMFHCLQTFYLNSFCCILSEHNNASFNETVMNSLTISCETTEKLGYFKAMRATYPYINQLLRLYIEYNLSNMVEFTEDTQESCLNLVLLLLEKLQNTEQLLKCDGCRVKSGLHDALRLSFLAKNFISASLNGNLKITKILDPFLAIIDKQHNILRELCRLGCSNHDKCLRKLQTDIHNTAILLNKAEHFDSAIKLFDTYLTHEFLHFKTEQDLKNISRALYNKSICELEHKLFEGALTDAFLSLIFSQPEGLSSEKYMSLVMDIKAKSSKSAGEEDELQLRTVLDTCCLAVERKLYGNLKPFFSSLNFSTLLQHEFTMYAKLWPSVVPVAGVWKALYRLVYEKQPPWILADPNTKDILYTTIIDTPSYVRTIHNPLYSDVVTSLLERERWPDDVSSRVVEATLLFLKAEFCMEEAAEKYEWKCKDQAVDPELVPCARRLRLEHAALAPAARAVRLLARAAPRLHAVPAARRAALGVWRAALRRLLHARRAPEALQLAHAAARLARAQGSRAGGGAADTAHDDVPAQEAYLECVGVALSLARKPSESLRAALSLGAEWGGRLCERDAASEPALVFMCEAAMFYHNTGRAGAAARLLRAAAARVLALPPDRHADSLAAGRLLDALALRGGLGARVHAQRHYLAVGNHESSWCSRQRRSLLLKQRVCEATEAVVALTRRLRLFRRSRAAAASALGAAGAEARVRLSAAALDTSRAGARATIDQRLKHIIGLPSNESALQPRADPSHPADPKALFTPEPKHLETMRDAQILKNNQTSPTIPVEYVPSFKLPEFFEHENDCPCYACETPSCLILACLVIGLEASVYYRAKETDIAKNYFDGVVNSFCTVEDKLKVAVKKLKEMNYEAYVVDIVETLYESELLNVELDILMEASYFELSQKNYAKADDYIYVRIHEILQAADVDAHLRNDIMNLMVTCETVRKTNKPIEKSSDIETELENLKLTPTKEILKTPESKPIKPPAFSKVVVSKDELPDLKCKIPVLNFDEPEEKAVPKKINFKIPIPITNKPVVEPIPRATRSKVNILVTEPSEEDIDVAMTPQSDKSKVEFFTPTESTPDQFFTPMTSLKTYTKKTLRQNIVKNLEEEFSQKEATKATNESKQLATVENKENSKVLEVPKRRGKVESGSIKTLKDSRLKRSTSPGKLPKDEKPTRTRRLPRPTSFVDKK